MDILARFHPLIASWFAERFGAPTDVQLRTWSEVSRGRHVLVTAPTGSGKTLAAFLWAINELVTGACPRGATRVLYISPLKALNNDVRKNLLMPLRELEARFREAGEDFPAISVQTRSGDTPGSERRRMLRQPPEILITTPESLNILLTSKGGRHALTGIRTAILDEIHAVAGSKRGTHLMSGVERLTLLCGEFQRIALSATVRPLEIVADFVGGFMRRGELYEKRPVSLIRAEQAKELSVEIRAPEAPAEPDEEFWPRLARACAGIIAEHRSTLFFANSRRTTERVTRLINEALGEEVAYSHHGSLSREIRLAVEERLKRGELKAIVATNSLELGIDIGKLDSVVLIQTPRSISSAVQRIGRSGHGVGEVSRGVLFPSHGMDYIHAAVMAAAIAEGDLEPLHPVEAPLDLLAQIILSMALSEEWDLDELYPFLKTCYPYRNLSRKHFDLVVGMLEGRYADSHVVELKPRASVDRLQNTISTREGLASLIYLEGGTIPDRGYFDLRLKDGGTKIGELDEEFVWERRIGDAFALGAQLWQICGITHNSVEVVAAQRPQQIIPFWRAEEMDRDFHYSQGIASFLEYCNEALAEEHFTAELSAAYALEPPAAQALADFLKRQIAATGSALPHRHHLLVEHFHDPLEGGEAQQAILHTLWGNALNRPFTFALAAAWEEAFGYPLQAFYNNDGIALLLPHDFETRHLFSLVTPENLERLLRVSLEKTGFFGARFRENAGRALLLPKPSFKRRMPLWLTRLRAKKLLGAVSRYRDFPVLIETWRSCLQDDFDLPNLRLVLAQIQEGEVRLGETRTSVASPFAEELIWQQTNKYVYEDDTPQYEGGTALGHDLIRELALSPHLRPRLPADLISRFENKRQRTAVGYAPDSARELVDWVKERVLLTEEEWARLLCAMERDHGVERGAILREAAPRIVHLRVPGAFLPFVAAIERLPEIAGGLRLAQHRLIAGALVEDAEVGEAVRRLVGEIFKRRKNAEDEEGAEDEELSTEKLLAQWLSFYGPMELSRIRETLGLVDHSSLPGLSSAPAPPPVEGGGSSRDILEEALESLEQSGQIVVDELTEGVSAPEICDAANLEALLRILRRSRQPSFTARPIAELPLFLAAFQGVARRGHTREELMHRLEQLFCLPLSASLWEEEVFPARLDNYCTPWLDSLMQTSDLAWYGCGEGKVTFSFPEDLALFRDLRGSDGGGEGERDRARRLIPDPQGRYSLEAIAMANRLSTGAALNELWRLAWKGEVSSDSFVTVRRGVLTRFTEPAPAAERSLRRPVPRRWQRPERSGGNWYLVAGEGSPPDPLEREELNKERVRLLLERYGILFRELLQRELPPLQWPRLFRTLRIMELSGEVLSGSFFLGIPGLQFISHEAFRLLSGGLPQDAIYWVNAADPASLCGVGLEGLKEELPPRVSGTHLVYRGSRLVVVSRRYGEELQIAVEPDDAKLNDYLSFFLPLVSRDFNARKDIEVLRINGVPVAESPYRNGLIEVGFQESYQGLELRKKY